VITLRTLSPLPLLGLKKYLTTNPARKLTRPCRDNNNKIFKKAIKGDKIMTKIKFASLKHIIQFKGPFTSFLAVGMLLLVSVSAYGNGIVDANVNWSHAAELQGTGGVENPVVKLGFNPQPEPQGHTGPRVDLTNPMMPVFITPTGEEPDFRIFFAIANLEDLRISAPGLPDSSGHFEFEVLYVSSSNKAYDVLFDITTSSGGVPDETNWVGFNPQPEPPGLDGAGMAGFDFPFTSYSDATLSMQVRDSTGNNLTFTPEPATVALLGLGSLVLLRKRRV
jgi:hypothetical protein